jgi:hypothetical protein
MPYVKPELRKEVEDYGELHHLLEWLIEKTKNGAENNGIVTYVIYAIIKKVYEDGNYETMSNALKVMESAKDEFLENILRPYEKKKKELNGDV